MGLILVFIIADRLEYYRFGPYAPRRVAIISVLLRIVLVEGVKLFNVLVFSPSFRLSFT